MLRAKVIIDETAFNPINVSTMLVASLFDYALLSFIDRKEAKNLLLFFFFLMCCLL